MTDWLEFYSRLFGVSQGLPARHSSGYWVVLADPVPSPTVVIGEAQRKKAAHGWMDGWMVVAVNLRVVLPFLGAMTGSASGLSGADDCSSMRSFSGNLPSLPS